jgi:hypothetical protein
MTTTIIRAQQKSNTCALLRRVFCQLEGLENSKITPKFVRSYLSKYVDREILEEGMIGLTSSDFWLRVETMIWLHIESRN